MRFTPVLIVYLVLLMMLGMTLRELNKCSAKVNRYKIHKQEPK